MEAIEVTEQKIQNVYDAENDNFVKITPEQRKYANYVYEQFKLSTLLNAAAIDKIFTEKLYLALGFESRDDFIANGTDLSRRQAYNLLSIARKFKPYLPELNENKQLTENTSSDTLVQTLHSKTLSELGISKLYELSRLNDEDLKTLIETGGLGEGDDRIELEEIREMAVRKATIELKKRTASYKQKIDKLSDEKSTLKEEIKLLESENDSLKNKIETAEELEKKFGAPASKIEHKKRYLREAEDILETLRTTLVKANIMADDIPSLTNQYDFILRSLDELHVNLLANYGYIPDEEEK